jgi:2-desacetyl-2-hydroxyethyl bacteriochlorophyllide A dehydrogenase
MTTMKAIRLVKIGEPLELHAIRVPEPGPNDALVRVKASGICHSDVHLWAGQHPVHRMPITLGHEIAGIVAAVGDLVNPAWIGQRVCLHYVVGCGECEFCRQGRESLCASAGFLAATLDGGFAEFISVPALNLVPLPPEVPFEHGAVLMCSAATSYHALSRARFKPGESVAVFGTGGVGMSAVQLARVFGATRVIAVDVQLDKLEAADRLGAIPVNAAQADPVHEIRQLTGGEGVDVALGIVGLAESMQQAVRSLRGGGRAVLVGMMADQPMVINPMEDVVLKEVEIIGSVDHSYGDLPSVIEFARQGLLDMSGIVERTIPLDATAINATFTAVNQFGSAIRTVVVLD